MKLTNEQLKQIIKEEMQKVLNEDASIFYETIDEIRNWGEENGHWSFSSSLEPWFEMMQKHDPDGLSALVSNSGKSSIEEFKQALIDLEEDYY